MRRPDDPVHAGDLVDQGQRETERVDGWGPLRLGHVCRVLERVGVVHVLHAARQRHDDGYIVRGYIIQEAVGMKYIIVQTAVVIADITFVVIASAEG